MNNKVCIYLRKSRADEELERTIGEGETLKKHKTALLKFAKERSLNIVEIKEEIVSGDSLFFRPKMLELLKEIQDKTYSGVLVMDIDRLGRGGMKDQGIILDAFKESKTKIITPIKTYDLENEFDEEMTEFKTFFARRELKTINRRMQGGRVRSVEEGNYIATNPPLGYDITFIQKSRTLKINEEEAEIVKLIFKMYADDNGANSIATYLNTLGFKSKTGNKFHNSSILFILKNPIYIGKVTWKKKEIKKSKEPGKLTNTKSRSKEDWIISDGKHKAIIDEKLFNICQNILTGKYHIPYKQLNKPVNPLAGLLICDICSRKMAMKFSRGIPRVLCTHGCTNISSKFEYVEHAIIQSLEEYLENYEYTVSNQSKDNDLSIYENQSVAIEREIETLKKQKSSLFDFLERGIYDDKTFLERSKNLEERIKKLTIELDNVKETISNKKTVPTIDTVHFKKIINAYKLVEDVQQKNNLLKAILYEIRYFKEKGARDNDFTITLSPKLLR